MAQTQQIPGSPQGRIFGVPFGDLGWFASLLMTLACGFITFFAATFLGIFSLLFYNVFTHNPVNYGITYRYFGLPAGLLALLIVGSFLGTLWARRISRRA
ncbi:hypothetical protein [Terriglobus tenax]|uniref:hypothetical protein n=1 Tax=Terriglobus tenax TaxID=1111115 RepID=UPI0021E082D5|nr:hypothetical protein [Terriglobus tenax]